MVEISGYVCAVRFPAIVSLFGKPSGNSNQPYCQLEENGLRPFDTKAEAEQARRSMRRHPHYKMQPDPEVRRVRIKIAETEEDMQVFAKSRNLFVLMMSKGSTPSNITGSCIFLGEFDHRGFRQANLTILGSSNFKRFKNLKTVKQEAAEAARQADSPTRVGQFLFIPAVR